MCKVYITELLKKLSPVHIPIKENDNIIDEDNHIKRFGFKISFSIGAQDTTYDYNNEFWDSI